MAVLSNTGGDVSLILRKSVDFRQTLGLYSSVSPVPVPVDITSWVFSASVVDETGSEVIPVAATIIDGPEGRLLVEIEGDDVAAITGEPTYRWYLDADHDSITEAVVGGSVEVRIT